ncbi:MAG: arylmalonate decarboxylase [Gammaproteobacteria bacterium]|nr:arylmalonate decarboxylase [Gammaproteobacteria bacterium]MBU2288448.1 arylmalonate decarboxylase [Gammaproteobacteria bacterium]MBU2408225.1 arylmalonate decarboxylase [Gammaproteobacteria bacterium]
MADSLGWRRKFAVLVPSTNTSVQPEFDDMRPPGVTNHISRIRIPNMSLQGDDDFNRLIALIMEAQDEAVDAVMSCEPDQLVLGISAETFWDGLAASRELKSRLEARTGLPVSMGADACEAALRLHGAKTIAVLTPYQPVGDRNVVRFFEESGYTVKRIHGLRCDSPVHIAHVTTDTLRSSLRQLDGDDIDAVVQVGTNLAMARLAAVAEREFAKPVLAINTTIYWHALRSAGIHDKMKGFGSLMETH